MHDDIVSQAAVIDDRVKQLAEVFDTNSTTVNDSALGEITPLTTKFNTTFVKAVTAANKTAFEQINTTYDALDAKLN